MVPTLMAAAGEPDVKQKLLEGYKAGNMSYKVHLDGYNWCPTSRVKLRMARARSSSIGPTMETRCAQVQQVEAGFPGADARIASHVWQDPIIPLRFPKLFNLRTDPFERADYEGIDYQTLVSRPHIPDGPCAGICRTMAAQASESSRRVRSRPASPLWTSNHRRPM